MPHLSKRLLIQNTRWEFEPLDRCQLDWSLANRFNISICTSFIYIYIFIYIYTWFESIDVYIFFFAFIFELWSLVGEHIVRDNSTFRLDGSSWRGRSLHAGFHFIVFSIDLKHKFQYKKERKKRKEKKEREQGKKMNEMQWNRIEFLKNEITRKWPINLDSGPWKLIANFDQRSCSNLKDSIA